jgi:hypothetical protein
MKALATLKNVDSVYAKITINRNLSRILDIRIIDIDIENGILCFLYSGRQAFGQVKKELARIGHPIQNYTNQLPIPPVTSMVEDLYLPNSGARRPYFISNQ